jgi:type IV pilus assembly protein PilC
MPGIDIKKIPIRSAAGKKETNSNLSNFLNKEIHLFGKQLSNKKKLAFYSDMHMLLSSGIDIKTTLELVHDNFPKKEDKKMIQDILQFVINGVSLSEALNKIDKFTPYEYYSIKIGEETGRLNEVLKELVTFFDKKIEQNRKIVSAFSYPTVVIVVAVVAITFMLNFIVPMFEDVFEKFKSDLPYLTKVVIKASHFFSQYGLLFVLVFLVLLGIYIFFKKQLWFRKINTAIILKIPLFGELIRKIQISRFCISMELLISSKIPIIHAIRLMQKMIGFYPIQSSLEIIENDIMHGKNLHDSLKKFPIYDKRMISLIKVGEEVNQLDVVFGKLKEQYMKEIDHQTGIVSSVMEPVMIILIGFFVAIILIAMYLPMFQLSTSFNL